VEGAKVLLSHRSHEALPTHTDNKDLVKRYLGKLSSYCSLLTLTR
jgi:hypothetical protein